MRKRNGGEVRDGSQEGKRLAEPGLAMETDRGNRWELRPLDVRGHKLSRTENAAIMSMLSLPFAKRARAMPPVRMEYRTRALGNRSVRFLYTEYERPGSRGPERSMVLGPVKWTTADQADRWFTCAKREMPVENEDRLAKIFETVQIVATPYEQHTGDWNSVLKNSRVESVTVKKPASRDRPGLNAWKSLWMLEFKGPKERDTVKLFLFFGVIFKSAGDVQKFLADWEKKCPGVDLGVVEQALLQVPVPTAAEVRPMTEVNQEVQQMNVPDIPRAAVGRRLYEALTSFFSSRVSG